MAVVEGNGMTISHAEFEERCECFIAEEQQKIAPDNALIDLLCQAVRLSRSHVTAMTDLVLGMPPADLKRFIYDVETAESPTISATPTNNKPGGEVL